MRIFAGTALLCLGLITPASAVGQGTAPPGNSEVDEYTETLPGPGGDNTIDRSNGGDPGVLAPGTEAELRELGPAGQATADLAKSTAPKSQGESRDGGGDGGSSIGGIADALAGSSEDGIGWLLPAALIATLLAGAFFVLLRRRAGHVD